MPFGPYSKEASKALRLYSTTTSSQFGVTTLRFCDTVSLWLTSRYARACMASSERQAKSGEVVKSICRNADSSPKVVCGCALGWGHWKGRRGYLMLSRMAASREAVSCLLQSSNDMSLVPIKITTALGCLFTGSSPCSNRHQR